MKEERLLTPARFFSALNHFVWQASQYYNAEHLRDIIIPRMADLQFRIARISSFAYGLISLDAYSRAYLSEMNHLITEFVNLFEEIMDSSLSDEEKFSKIEAELYAFFLRLVVLEDEVKRDYIKKTLEEYLEKHREVFGKDFTLKDLYYTLGRIVEDDEDEESPLIDKDG